MSGGGILRRGGERPRLLVFGYSCKLFRDDERALHVELGRHLIPCPADESLSVDRYDFRAHLAPAELRAAEDPPSRRPTQEETRVELLCDEERYRLEQEQEQQEEPSPPPTTPKYGRVDFKYETEQNDEPFVVPEHLPSDIIYPDTCKLNAVMEKTAAFIASQDTQMEILLKAKQANNPQFAFLSPDSPLHAYYRFLLTAAKERRTDVVLDPPQNDRSDQLPEDHYLHPSLAPVPLESAPSVPSIPYKPSADCAYAMLVSEIKGTTDASENDPAAPGTESVSYDYSYYRCEPDEAETGVDAKSAPGLRLIHYSDSEDDDEENSADGASELVKIPPPIQQSIVDKMASYVARNGNDFEQIVRMKGDPRFSFLDESHEFNPYYRHKRRFYEAGQRSSLSRVDEEAFDEDDKKTIAPVSFSIKKMKEPEPVLPKPALRYESSEEDGDAETQIGAQFESAVDSFAPKSEVIAPSDVALTKEIKQFAIEPPRVEFQPKLYTQYVYQIQPTVTAAPAPVKKVASDKPSVKADSGSAHNRDDYKGRKRKRPSAENGKSAPTDVITIDEELDARTAAELIDLTGECYEDDKSRPRNNSIQLDRKRRAAAFLSSLKSVPTAPVEQHNTLASAMVKTLHTLQNRDEDHTKKRDDKSHKRKKSDRPHEKYYDDYYVESESWRHSSREPYRWRHESDRHLKKSKRKKSRDRSRSSVDNDVQLQSIIERKSKPDDDMLAASLKRLVRETRMDMIPSSQPIKMAVDIFATGDATSAYEDDTPKGS